MLKCGWEPCGKDFEGHGNQKYCCHDHYLLANAALRKKHYRKYKAKYKGCYRKAYCPKVTPEKTMCKCPLCEIEFLGSPWQGKYSYCDSCERQVSGISDLTYQIGRGQSSGHDERGSYYA